MLSDFKGGNAHSRKLVKSEVEKTRWRWKSPISPPEGTLVTVSAYFLKISVFINVILFWGRGES